MVNSCLNHEKIDVAILRLIVVCSPTVSCESRARQVTLKDLPNLPIESLQQVREQLESEYKMMSGSLANLRQALQRVETSKRCIQNISKREDGTKSIY